MRQPIAKPEPLRKKRAREKREEAAAIKDVRARVFVREQFSCRVYKDGAVAILGACGGTLQWAHASWKRRSRTRGLPPEERHTTEGSMALCDRHHDAYDEGHAFEVEPMTDRGCDGRLKYVAYVRDGNGRLQEDAVFLAPAGAADDPRPACAGRERPGARNTTGS